jgi:predicted porin
VVAKKFALKASALAAALCMTSLAHAQSSVTLYGIADAGILYLSKTAGPSSSQSGGAQVAVTNSGYLPSVFGLKGTEDLGGGYKASFALESGISLSNGGFDNPGDGNGFFNRQANVSLSGGFGTVTAGLQYSPFFLSTFFSDPRGYSQFGSMLHIYVDNAAGVGVFNPNAISYTSPEIAGFQARAMLALGGVAGNFQVGRQYSGSLEYTNGTFLATVAYYNGNANPSLVSVNPLDIPALRGLNVGLGYKIGGLQLRTSFTNFKTSLAPVPGLVPASAVGTNPTNVNVYSFGGDYMVLPMLDVNGGVYYSQDRLHSGDHSVMVALGTQFFLSKRTALYAQVGAVNNKCSADGHCLGTGLTPDSSGSGMGGIAPVGGVGAFPTGTTVGAVTGIRVLF